MMARGEYVPKFVLALSEFENAKLLYNTYTFPMNMSMIVIHRSLSGDI